MHQEKVIYFAYGSNMNPKRMLERNVEFSNPQSAKLHGYKLTFNKKARDGDYGYANIEEGSENDFVEGIAYETTLEGIKRLDHHEGYPNHYDKKNLPILNEDDEELHSIVYVAQPNKVVIGLKPQRDYLKHLLLGKPFLSVEYFEKLSQVQTHDGI